MRSLKHFDFHLKDFFISVFKEKIYLVGGTIRDYLLYGEIDNSRDIDLVVIDHDYNDIEKKLKKHGKTNTVGKSFAVVKFTKDGCNFDISVPRKDTRKSEDSHGHKNFVVESGPHIPLEEDLKRRDFTCNSIALRLADNEVVDPFAGRKAIADRRIYMSGPDTFFDDPLRILRCARFASVHKFTVDPEIYVNSKDVRLDELSKERITEELFRLLLESDQPSLGMDQFWRLTVLEKLFPRLYTLTLTIQDAQFHPETDEFGHHTVWAHTLIALDIARKLAKKFALDEEQTLALLLGVLLHDIGKGITTRWEFKRGRMTITSVFHDTHGEIMADNFLTDLRIETRKNFPLKKVVLKLVKYHHRIYELYKNREMIGFKAISRLVRDLEDFDLLLVLLDVADRRSREPNPLDVSQPDPVVQWYKERKEEFNINKDTIKPIVMGRHLLEEGMSPGKEMGNYLEILYERQLDGEFSTLEKGLSLLRQLRAEKEGANGTPGN